MSHPYPARIVQFGEGNFLRAFIDWMVQGLNDRAGFQGSVTLAKTIPGDFHPAFEAQKYRYNLVIRGRDGDKVVHDRHLIESLGGTINPYADFAGYLAAASKDLKVIVSNTTEAGIAYDETDAATDKPAKTYPGKLTQFLRARFEALGGGSSSELAILPCELIEKNGQTLKKYVLAHADRWYHDQAFTAWLEKDILWYDTLVDRIVPGHDPEERARCQKETGFDDQLIVVTEPYHIFVVQGPEREDILPFKKAGFNVVWTNDLTPWRTRKVRILNGGHTFLAMVGLGLGVPTVRESLEHPVLGPALDAFYAQDVLPYMNFPAAELKAYHATILDRFANPFVVHKLGDIALNSVSKYISRILPGAQEVVAQTGKAPRYAAFGLAALVERYLHTDGIKDDAPILAKFQEIAVQTQDPAEQAQLVFASPVIWVQGAVLPPALVALATEQYVKIRKVGLEAALKEELARG
jgi:tagaturonate reductase